MKAAATALAEMIATFEAVPTEERTWLVKNLRAYMTGSNGGSSSRLNHQVEPQVEVEGSTSLVEQGVCSGFFLQFWTAYPRKQGKKDAEAIYKKLKPDQELQDRILQALLEQKSSEQWTKEFGQYIPLPKTWLNRGSWDDETRVEVQVEPRFGRTSSKVFRRFIQGDAPEVQS